MVEEERDLLVESLAELIADYRQEKELVMKQVESQLARIERKVTPSLRGNWLCFSSSFFESA